MFPEFRNTFQQDAEEFMTMLIDNCIPLKELCSFITKTYLKCMNCNTEFERTNDQGQKIVDTCNMLQVGITDVTVEQILKDHLAPEEINDDWKCSKCNSVQKCLKTDGWTEQTKKWMGGTDQKIDG